MFAVPCLRLVVPTLAADVDTTTSITVPGRGPPSSTWAAFISLSRHSLASDSESLPRRTQAGGCWMEPRVAARPRRRRHVTGNQPQPTHTHTPTHTLSLRLETTSSPAQQRKHDDANTNAKLHNAAQRRAKQDNATRRRRRTRLVCLNVVQRTNERTNERTVK